MSDTLYAFDADTGGAALWSANFATRVGATSVPMAQFAFSGNRNITGNLGILSTPVIDPATNILYLVACTLENNSMAYRLHAVDIRTGAEPYGPGTLISASYYGSTFDARFQTQRVSLAIAGNQVVFGFAAVQLEYAGGYVGWVMAYDKQTLQQSGVFATVTTGGRGGGVWQSGRPPAVDSSGKVYVFTGNGFGGGYDGINNFSETVLKMDPAAGLSLLDWFTPSNWSSLDANDLDLSSSGPMLIPGTNLLGGGGKSGEFYLLNTASLGRESANDGQIVQELQIAASYISGGPVYWQRSAANGGPLLYNWGASDWVKAYAFNGTSLNTSPSFQGSGTQLWPGGILALSANGDQPGSGVLWATVATTSGAWSNPPVPGELHAFNASDVSQELWNSSQNASRDGFGNFAKFVPPTVANGKVYVATWSSQVAVYGLLSSFSLSSNSLPFGNELTNAPSMPLSVTVTNTGQSSLPILGIALSTGGTQPFSQTNTCGTSVAVDASCSINVVFNPAVSGPASSILRIGAGNGLASQTVALGGTGVAPSFSVSANSLTFGSQALNVASAPISITVRDTGTLALPITYIALSTLGGQPFSETNNCGVAVPAGGYCDIDISFDPDAAGAASAALFINTAGGSSTIQLSGNGTFKVLLNASAPSVTVGEPVTLTWTSAPGATCTPQGGNPSDHWSGVLGNGGSQAVVESTSGIANYSLICQANGVQETGSVTVMNTLPTVSLAATATAVTVGGSVTLDWTSSDATSCVASGGQASDGWSGVKSTSGSASVTANAAGSVTYTLTCSSGSKSVAASAEVTANAPVAANDPTGSGGGGGALGSMEVLSLLGLIGWRQRRIGHSVR